MAEEPETTSADEATPDTPPEGEAAAEAPTDASVSGATSSADEAPAADDAPTATASAPAATLPPKERRRRERAAKAAAVPTRPQTSPEERQAEREAERARKAQIRSQNRKRMRDKARTQRTETPEPLAPRREQHPGQQKTRQGIVVSDKANKTIVVRIDVTRRHRSYGKVVRTSTTLHAHDEREDAHIGDTVVVRESRPLSRTKRWRLIEVVERAK
jgi:small subunit ribosomal protein S17